MPLKRQVTSWPPAVRALLHSARTTTADTTELDGGADVSLTAREPCFALEPRERSDVAAVAVALEREHARTAAGGGAPEVDRHASERRGLLEPLSVEAAEQQAPRRDRRPSAEWAHTYYDEDEDGQQA